MDFQEMVMIESTTYTLIEISDTYACLMEDEQKREFFRLRELEDMLQKESPENTFLAYRCNQYGPNGWEIQCILPDGKDYFNAEIDVDRIPEGALPINVYRLAFHEQENKYEYVDHEEKETLDEINRIYPMFKDTIIHYLEKQPQYRLHMATQSMAFE